MPAGNARGLRARLVAALLVAGTLLAACTPGMMGGRMGSGMMGGGGPPPETTPAPTVTPGGAETVSFAGDVAPILRDRCVACHGGSGGLWLDRYETLMVGADRGPVVVAGDPVGSELLRRVTGDSQPRMPFNLPPLDGVEIEKLRVWIAEGALKN